MRYSDPLRRLPDHAWQEAVSDVEANLGWQPEFNQLVELATARPYQARVRNGIMELFTSSERDYGSVACDECSRSNPDHHHQQA